VARDFRDVQVKNDKVRLEIGLIEYLQRLLTVPCDVEMNRYLAFCERLPHQKHVAGVILDEQHFMGLYGSRNDSIMNRFDVSVLGANVDFRTLPITN